MFGANRTNTATTNLAEFDSLSQGQTRIQNQMSMDNLSQSLNSLGSGMCSSTYSLNNSIKDGFNGLQNQLCREFNGVISSMNQMAWNLSDRINATSNQSNMQFQAVLNKMQECCCATQKSISDSTCTIVNAFKDQETQNLRDRLAEKSQNEQTVAFLSNNNANASAILNAIGNIKKAA